MMIFTIRSYLSLFIVAGFFQNICQAQTKLSNVFGNNMVLQRDDLIKVWGWSNNNSTIYVDFKGVRTKAETDGKGKWMASLPPSNAGGPFEMKIYTDKNKKPDKILKNILVGDVWLASGQSNMEWQVQQAMDFENEIRNANYPQIRMLNVQHDKKITTREEIKGGNWQVCNSENIKSFSAVAYYFVRHVHFEEGIPIGIIQATWGGTPVEAWTSREKLLTCDIARSKVIKNDSITVDYFVKDSLDLIRFWQIVYNPQDQIDQVIPQLNYDDSTWENIPMPETFKNRYMPFYEGMVWMRKKVVLPPSMPGKDVTVNLGLPEMNYSFYVNGHEVCKTQWNANPSHEYTLPADILVKDTNIFTLRLAFLWGGGGLNPPAENLYITDGQTNVSLAGNWKYKMDLEAEIPKIYNYHRYPAYLFNAMINPLIPYALKGFIWYQGEDNTDEAKDYVTLFPLMINDWRERWHQGNLPFLYVQLANYMKRYDTPTESNWALLREAQTKTLSLPETGMACIIDLGEENNIHPKNKQEVGKRLALIAEEMVYHKEVESSGPVFKEFKIEEEKIIISFTETGTGLTTSGDDEIKGFTVAGKDHTFYNAHAYIENNKVAVTCEKVKNPVAVRYAWADNPACNLINVEGLPAIPFRTDDW